MSIIFPSTLSSISFFTTIYTVIGLVILYPYFSNHKKYYLLVIIFGILFDILYTSTFILNLIIFLIVSFVIKILYDILSENVFMTNLISVVAIILYHLLSFVILSIFGSINYDFMLLINIILHSILMTIIYTSISYFVIKFIYSRLNIKQIK
ncbi:MAG: hypothetical protein IJZ46_01095 [Bacilli bacterium]|nr:hypothetical protein [Bacilli bacterium]